MLKKSAYIIIILINLLLGMLYGCKEQQPMQAQVIQPEQAFSVKGSVKEMTLTPLNPPEFPEHPGKTEFTSYCGICHSLRYISAQPDFPRKTWEAEVKKMIEKYGAPIDSANSAKIIDYLVAIKGSES